MKQVQSINLIKKYPPSKPCGCPVCLDYCRRPGWWTVAQASRVMNAGLAGRMMLEISPERSFAVLSPAFRGCEGSFALQHFADQGCNFQMPDRRCELHGGPFLPLECSFCHHDRQGQGPLCHTDIENDWRTESGRILVRRWCRQAGLWDLLEVYGLSRFKK